MPECMLVVFSDLLSAVEPLQLPTFCSCNDLHDRSATFCISVLQKTAMVMKECCQNYRYKFSQFRAVFELRKVEQQATGKEGTNYRQTGSGVEYKGMDVYTKAFQDRIVRDEVAAE